MKRKSKINKSKLKHEEKNWNEVEISKATYEMYCIAASQSLPSLTFEFKAKTEKKKTNWIFS